MVACAQATVTVYPSNFGQFWVIGTGEAVCGCCGQVLRNSQRHDGFHSAPLAYSLPHIGAVVDYSEPKFVFQTRRPYRRPVSYAVFRRKSVDSPRPRCRDPPFSPFGIS